MNRKQWFIAAVAACCLVPSAFADRGRDHNCDPHRERCQQQSMPEGGSAAIYLLGAGLTCVGAMVLRSKVAKSTQS